MLSGPDAHSSEALCFAVHLRWCFWTFPSLWISGAVSLQKSIASLSITATCLRARFQRKTHCLAVHLRYVFLTTFPPKKTIASLSFSITRLWATIPLKNPLPRYSSTLCVSELLSSEKPIASLFISVMRLWATILRKTHCLAVHLRYVSLDHYPQKNPMPPYCHLRYASLDHFPLKAPLLRCPSHSVVNLPWKPHWPTVNNTIIIFNRFCRAHFSVQDDTVVCALHIAVGGAGELNREHRPFWHRNRHYYEKWFQ